MRVIIDSLIILAVCNSFTGQASDLTVPLEYGEICANLIPTDFTFNDVFNNCSGAYGCSHLGDDQTIID